MKQLLPYRIISFILLPIAAFFGMMVFLLLFIAMANPALLLPLFVFAGVVVYIITSFIFLQKGIDQKKVCKHSLKDLIKVNAIVSIIFGVMALVQSVGILMSPGMQKEVVAQVMLQQQNNPTVFSEQMALKIVMGMLYFMLFFSVLLLTHIFISFRLLKTHAHLFAPKP